MDVQAGYRRPDRGDDLRVVVTGERRMNSALEADLGRAPHPRLDRPAHDLVQRHEECGAAQVLGELALRERAEAASEVTDVRVLDVARDDVRDLVSAHLRPQPVGGGEHTLALPAAGRQEALDLVPAEILAPQLQRDRVAPDDERDSDLLPRSPTILAGEPERIRRPADGGRDRGVDPTIQIGDVLGVEREARRQRETPRSRRLAQPLDRGPRRLGVDMVDVTGETPPQSSIPASRRRGKSS